MEKPKIEIEVDLDELNLILVSLNQHNSYIEKTITRLSNEGREKFQLLASKVTEGN
jgi:hypothetical protein